MATTLSRCCWLLASLALPLIPAHADPAAGAAPTVSLPASVAAAAPEVTTARADAEAAAAADDAEFPTSALLKPRVAFWKRVFAEWSEYQSALHDIDDVSRVYTVLDFRADAAVTDPNVLARRRKQAENEARAEIEASLTRLQARLDRGERIDAASLPPDDARVQAVLAGDTAPDRYRAAIDRLRYQRGLRERTQRALEVSGRYLPEMERIFASYGLPTRLTRLPLVESSFNVEAYSKAAAAGLWQFIPSSARIYMRLDSLVDDRRDPWTSTDAAARHLRDDYAALGSWPLALTAYNHGRAGIARGLANVGGTRLEDLITRYEHKSFGFASSNFYAEFLAASEVERDHRRHFGDVRREPPLHFDTFTVADYVDYDTLRRLAGTDPDEFRRLNPAYRPAIVEGRLRIPPGHVIRIPAGSQSRVAQAYATLSPAQRHTAQLKTFELHRVGRGETLGQIARRYGLSQRELMRTNDLANANRLRVGQTLQVPIRLPTQTVDAGPAARPASSARPVRVRSTPELTTHKVRRGQTLGAIARRYQTTIAKLRELNGFSESDVLRAGSVIQVPHH